MTAESVVEILDLLERAGIQIWVDGGWGVDALLGEQTRPHEDLDIAILHKDVPLLRSLLAELGFSEIPRDDTWECNFVLQDSLGRIVDVHSVTFDEHGNHVFGVKYPFNSLQGIGVILGREVMTITPEWMVQFHKGYPLDENDWHDVRLLCENFGLPIPSEYKKWVR